MSNHSPGTPEQLHELLSTINAIVSEFDVRTSEFTYVSAALERTLGYSAEEFLGSPRFWFSCLHSDDRERVRGLSFAANSGRPAEPFDYRIHAADGRIVWLRDHSRVLLDDERRPAFVRGVSVDVTALKEAEAAGDRARSQLEATLAAERTFERRYRETLENVALIAASIDANGTVRFANDFLLELTGWSRDEVVGHDWFERFDDDPEVRDDYFECMARGEIRPHFESTIRTRSGEIRIVSWSSTLERDENDVVNGIVTIGEDVTERRRAEEELRRREEHFRSLIENASDVISVLSASGTSLYESPSIERVLGWTPEELVGSRNFALRHPDDEERVAAIVERVLAGEEAEPIEFRLRHKDGSWRTVEAVAQMRLQDGAPVLVSNYRDVTERRELEQQLLHSQRLEAVGSLAGGIAHDFNNLLTAIGGYSEFLIGSFDPEDPRREDALEIARAADRAAALTRQLLAFSRRQVMRLEVLELATVVTDLETLLARLLGEDVEVRTSAEPGCFVEADRGQLEQVITNLAVNARDAMPGGGRLTISTRHVGHAGVASVELAVSDTGTGMDADTLSHLFEPFFTTKDTSKGSGLGLATVYGIVAQSGGEVLVDSALGEGSCFRVLLPLAARPDAPAEIAATSTPLTTGTETVLLVEDEATIRHLVNEVLSRSGYTVLTAPAGAEAIGLLRANVVDLLLTDVVMPGMSGPDLARVATAERPGLRVLFTSGYTNEPDELLTGPSAAFIGKPFSPTSLVAKVREVLDL